MGVDALLQIGGHVTPTKSLASDILSSWKSQQLPHSVTVLTVSNQTTRLPENLNTQSPTPWGRPSYNLMSQAEKGRGKLSGPPHELVPEWKRFSDSGTNWERKYSHLLINTQQLVYFFNLQTSMMKNIKFKIQIDIYLCWVGAGREGKKGLGILEGQKGLQRHWFLFYSVSCGMVCGCFFFLNVCTC